MRLLASWPWKLAEAFDDPTNERLRSTELWMAALRLLRVSLGVLVASFWLTLGEVFRLVALRDVVTLRFGFASLRLRGVTLWRAAGALKCILGAERMDGAADRKDGAECPMDRPIDPPPPPPPRPPLC